jgi:signal transduction histidine kinase
MRLLQLPARWRFVLMSSALVVSLGIYWLGFPTTTFGGVLMLPLVLAAWLFGWRGGLLCLASISLLLGMSYSVAFGKLFWSSAWALPFLMGTLSGLAVCLIVGSLRRMTNALLSAKHEIARTEQAYQQEHVQLLWKNEVLQNLSHELRTPLTQIQGYLELLVICQEQVDAATQARFITHAQQGCEELLNLITAVMEAEPVEGRPQPCHLSMFALQHEIQAVLAHFEPRFLKDYHLQLALPASLQVYADPRFVRQIVRNLLTNISKYTPAQTCITVSAAPHEQAGMICVRISDQGPGIPPEQQSLLFQRFVRLPRAAASKQPGTGLGLTICKQLVEAMGGRIWIESTGREGEGCCFAFTLASGPGTSAGRCEMSNGISDRR